MSQKQKHYWSFFTDNNGSMDLYGKSFRKGMAHNSYKGRTVFKARALTDMFPLTANQLMALDGGSTGDGGTKRFAFKARIIGDNSPHSFLPDPCDPAYAEDEDITYRVIAMHTTFISTNIIEGQPVTRGDIVLVEMEKSDQAYGLEYGRYINTLSVESPVDTEGTACASLVGLVGGWEQPQNMPMAGTATGNWAHQSGKYYQCKGDNDKCGPKDDSTFAKCKSSTYDSLAKKPTTFQKYTEAQVIAAIKASGQPAHIQKIMFVFVVKEQPKFSFPNNNVAGIQLDGGQFGGTSQADFDYQTCFRDGGGDQRIFAGFDTLERGMTVFGKTVAGKMKVFQTPSGASIEADAEILTWNYYRQWNLALSPDELVKLKADGQITRRGKVYKKNWGKVKSSFEASLTKWKSA